MLITDEARRFRYPRTQPFEDSELDQRVFFGREAEISELLRRVMSTRLLVLYSRSGLGKTSLLQAGIFHKLREQGLLPLLVRVNEVGRPCMEMFQDAIAKACKAQGVDDTPGTSSGLWEFFKTAVFWREGKLQTPVLVLDQFEELFTLHGPQSRTAVATELGELMASQLPAAVRARREAGESLPYSDKPPTVKLILSLRESYLGELEELTTALPQVMADRYRLIALNRENATRAIVEPARREQALGFRTPPFEYTEDALQEMLEFLGGEGDVIEPFALQLLCAHIERKLVVERADREADVTIHRKDLGGHKGMEKVLTTFYRDVMAGLPKRRERKRAKRLCAEGLLSPEGRRLSLEEAQILRTFKVRKQTLARLVCCIPV